ncbi:MAG: hypothetical protein D4R94_06905 [Chitinophagaceae bacterium]|nr:MAG: hypothetical protein D4R94_06905 [Chitinophagaceae bacterium]
MTSAFRKFFTLLFLLCLHISNYAQINIENNIALSKDSSLLNTIIKQFRGKPSPFIDSTFINLNKYVQQVAKYEGKRIRSIQIEQKHFGTSVTNANNIKKDALTKFADKLHNKNSENTIRKNLLIHEQEILDPLVIAYNEKWLRDLPYLQDARILSSLSTLDTNEVDIYIITKDIFPFGGSFNIRNADSYNATFSTENANDGGNAFSLSHNFDKNREINTGWGFDYTSRNVKGSFTDITLGAKSFAPNIADGELSESTFYINGNRPLLTPNSKWTWGFDFNKANNKNVFLSKWSDSLFNSTYNYNLKYFDAWIGYQLFSKQYSLKANNSHYFVQMRYFENLFQQRPTDYLAQIDKNYQNIQAYLSSFTLFKQKIIRTQYLYGFGRNEDLPTGKSAVITAGTYSRERNALPYLGIQLESYKLLKNENFRHTILSAGSSYDDGQLQDLRFIVSLEQINKLRYLESGFKYRSIINVSFTETLKNKFNEALLISSSYGIPQLNNERIYGGSRITANWESVWYNSKSFFGFRTSPFAFGNITYLRTVGQPIGDGDIYSSLGSGMRLRNENLIFGTIELKAFYFPRTNRQVSPWNVSLITNLRYKYNSSIISKPNFVQIN